MIDNVATCSEPVNLTSACREKWRSLGQMTRQEAMKRYTTALDNLVDDWKRSTTVRNSNILAHSSSASSEAPTSSPARVRSASEYFSSLLGLHYLNVLLIGSGQDIQHV